MPQTLEDRFRKKVDRRGPADCWPWLGAKNNQGGRGYGHGLFYWPITGVRRMVGAHVASWLLEHGGDRIAPGGVVRHACDNPSCVNPAHLVLGTQLDNMRDKVERGRAASGAANGAYTMPERRRRGGEHGMAKLNEDTVRLIRLAHADGVRQVELARRHGVTQANISEVVRRKTWQHVD